MEYDSTAMHRLQRTPAHRIERVRELPIDSLGILVTDSEHSGSRFLHRLVDEWRSGANRFDRPGEALFGAWVEGQMVGICGLNVDPYGGDDRVGRIRHLYVLSPFRRLGVGRDLVTRVVGIARGRFDLLRLRTANPAAARLYEALGFRPSGEAAAEATHVMTCGPARARPASPTSPRGGIDA